MNSISASALLGMCLTIGSGCATEPEPGDLLLPAGAELGDERVCGSPVSGRDRLREESVARGLDVLPWSEGSPPGPPATSKVVATDLDGDGDVDLLMPDFPGWYQVMANDGSGQFTARGRTAQAQLPPPGNVAAADLDGDGLPDLIAVGDGYVATQQNLGGLSFADPVLQYRDEVEPIPRFFSLALGDLDADGDLDLIVPAVHALGPPGPGLQPGSADLLFRNDAESFVLVGELSPSGTPGHSQVAMFTDRDADGDLDLLIPSEFGMESEPTAFFRNDGLGGDWVSLTNDAPETGSDLRVAAMGIDAADLNGDGAMDYCVSDFGPVRCLLTDGEFFVESADALGFGAPTGIEDNDYASWGVELVDLDADGFLDAAVAAGSPDENSGQPQPDQLYFGGLDGFEDVSEETGFDDPAWRYGLVAADLDGDGFRDLVMMGWDRPPKLWMNRCSSGSWLEVDLVGDEKNVEGFGARVQVTSWSTSQVRELHTVRSFNQGPSELHFGLGADTYAATVEVRWPDGAVQVAENVPLNRRLTLRR